MNAETSKCDSDGRRRRSERSRKLIIGALLELIRSGDMHPSARKVADTADVSLRTVYRLFEDVETLYRAVAEHIEAELMPRVCAPYESNEWADRLDEFLERRIAIYEDILLLKAAASIRRFDSDLLMAYHRRFIEIERQAIAAAMVTDDAPETADPELMDAVINFETWYRLRKDLDLSVEAARARVDKVLIALDRTGSG
ncbi:MAG: TetR/AcrR family transcriptional regulator [Pseudomonadota bacterium]